MSDEVRKKSLEIISGLFLYVFLRREWGLSLLPVAKAAVFL